MILGWPYEDPFVTRLLQSDIPQLVKSSSCRIWVYSDPNGQFVGFGSLVICDFFSEDTGGKLHPYIPLLAVNPTIKSMGYGTTIVRYLMAKRVSVAPT